MSLPGTQLKDTVKCVGEVCLVLKTIRQKKLVHSVQPSSLNTCRLYKIVTTGLTTLCMVSEIM